ncbi:MAG: hypothetical protein ACRD0K_04945 [Egibacteraceae bacterium]
MAERAVMGEMHKHRFNVELVSAKRAKAVIDSARDLLRDRQVELTELRAWESPEVLISAAPSPGRSVVITVKPRQGPADLVRGGSVLLYPDDPAHPERIGVLDRSGQLRVSALAPVPHSIMFLAPWWLDDRICEEVSRGYMGWALIQAPVMLPEPLEAEELEAAAWQKGERSDRYRRTYRSADGLLEYAVERNGDFLVHPTLHDADPGGLAAVCLAEVASRAPARVRTPYSLFDQQRPDGWWHADPIRCKRLLMLGAQAQVPPPQFGSFRVDPRIRAALASDSVRRRWAAAVELRAEFMGQHDSV